MPKARFVVSAEDPRAPSPALWDVLTSDERARILATLPSEVERAAPPEGDRHRIPEARRAERLAARLRALGIEPDSLD